MGPPTRRRSLCSRVYDPSPRHIAAVVAVVCSNGTAAGQRQQIGSSLVEAFPAAQLKAWAVRYQGYSGASVNATSQRSTILDGLIARGLVATPPQSQRMVAQADALDAVICLYAAKATSGALLYPPLPTATLEGWISVHA